jgi:predicted nuclease of predicted toxin-antitoxin system
LRHASDEVLADWACTNRATIVTKDEDFLSLAAMRAELQVVWIRIGNISNPDLIRRVGSVWALVCERARLGDKLTEVR